MRTTHRLKIGNEGSRVQQIVPLERHSRTAKRIATRSIIFLDLIVNILPWKCTQVITFLSVYFDAEFFVRLICLFFLSFFGVPNVFGSTSFFLLFKLTVMY